MLSIEKETAAIRAWGTNSSFVCEVIWIKWVDYAASDSVVNIQRNVAMVRISA